MSVRSNEIVQFGFRLAWKTRCEDERGSQRAGLTDHRRAGGLVQRIIDQYGLKGIQVAGAKSSGDDNSR